MRVKKVCMVCGRVYGFIESTIPLNSHGLCPIGDCFEINLSWAMNPEGLTFKEYVIRWKEKNLASSL
jgi:hypothetical protein